MTRARSSVDISYCNAIVAETRFVKEGRMDILAWAEKIVYWARFVRELCH